MNFESEKSPEYSWDQYRLNPREHEISRDGEKFEILSAPVQSPFCDAAEARFAARSNRMTTHKNVSLRMYVRNQSTHQVEVIHFPRTTILQKSFGEVKSGIVVEPKELMGLICDRLKESNGWVVARPFEVEHLDLTRAHHQDFLTYLPDVGCELPAINVAASLRRPVNFQEGAVLTEYECTLYFRAAFVVTEVISPTTCKVEKLKGASMKSSVVSLASLSPERCAAQYDWYGKLSGNCGPYVDLRQCSVTEEDGEIVVKGYAGIPLNVSVHDAFYTPRVKETAEEALRAKIASSTAKVFQQVEQFLFGGGDGT